MKKDVSELLPSNAAEEIPDIKREMFARAVVKNGLSPQKAGKELFDSAQKGISMMNNREVQLRVKHLMQENGLSLKDIVSHHKDLLNATKMYSSKDIGTIEVADNTTRLGAVNLAYDVWGATRNDKTDATSGVSYHSVEHSVSEESIEKLREIAREIRGLTTPIDVEFKEEK
jgi:hypothetical protein